MTLNNWCNGWLPWLIGNSNPPMLPRRSKWLSLFAEAFDAKSQGVFHPKNFLELWSDSAGCVSETEVTVWSRWPRWPTRNLETPTTGTQTWLRRKPPPLPRPLPPRRLRQRNRPPKSSPRKRRRRPRRRSLPLRKRTPRRSSARSTRPWRF